MDTNSSLCTWGRIVARTLIALVFIPSVYGKLTNFQGTAGFVEAKGVPLAPVLLAIATVLELGGMLLMITGFKPRIGALMLILFLVPVTPIFHNFWAVPDAERQMQMGNFLKNLAVIGGLGMVACADWARRRGS